MFYLSHNLSWMGWNLLLAGIPLVCFSLSVRFQPRWQSYVFLILGILFLPNALYLYTDLIHFPRQYSRLEHPERYWLLVQYSLLVSAGTILHLTSFVVLQEKILRPKLLQMKTNDFSLNLTLFIHAVILNLLIAIGITMGRFSRTNSWYLFTHPQQVVIDLFEVLTTPQTQSVIIAFWTFANLLLLGSWLTKHLVLVLTHSPPPLTQKSKD